MTKPTLAQEQWTALQALLTAQRSAVAECMEASFQTVKAQERFERAHEEDQRARKAVDDFFEVRK